MLWYDVQPALNVLHRWHAGNLKWIQLAKACLEELFLQKSSIQYDVCCNTGWVQCSDALSGLLLNPLPLRASWESRRRQGLQKQPSVLLRTTVISQDSSPNRHVGGEERSFLLLYSTHIRRKVQKLTKWIDIFVCLWLSTEGKHVRTKNNVIP